MDDPYGSLSAQVGISAELWYDSDQTALEPFGLSKLMPPKLVQVIKDAAQRVFDAQAVQILIGQPF